MRIEVTAQHIAAGIKCKCRACPLALAIEDATGRGYSVGAEVNTDIPYAYAFFQHVRVRLPAECYPFIRHFDAGLPVLPFVFHADFPPLVSKTTLP